jgi:hypothetical protein
MNRLVRAGRLIALGAAIAPLWVGALASSPAQAASAPTNASGVAIVLRQAELTVAPGESAVAVAQVANATKTTVHLKLFPGVAVELPNGGYKLVGGGAAARWLKLSTYQVTLAPNRVAAISYRIAVPTHVAPGYYLLGIVSQFIGRKVRGHSGNVGIVVNIAMQNTAPVVVHVPGPTTFGAHLSGWTVAWLGRPGYELQTTLTNSGNAYEYVKAHLTLINGSKRTVFPTVQVFVLRGASMTLTFVVPAVDVGPHTLAVVAAIAPHHSATASGRLRPPGARR